MVRYYDLISTHDLVYPIPTTFGMVQKKWCAVSELANLARLESNSSVHLAKCKKRWDGVTNACVMDTYNNYSKGL